MKNLLMKERIRSKEERVFSLKKKTWRDINIICLIILFIGGIGHATVVAQNSQDCRITHKCISPLAERAAFIDAPPQVVTVTKIVYAANPTEVKQAARTQFTKEEWPVAEKLINQESGFNPTAINKSSGACSLAQALPCSKLHCELTDVSCQLDWIKNYVYRRYHSFSNAWGFHLANNWY